MTFDESIVILGMPTSPTEIWLAKGRCLGVTHDGESQQEIERQLLLAKQLLKDHGIEPPNTVHSKAQ